MNVSKQRGPDGVAGALLRRRSFLTAGMGAGLAGVLAGCAGPDTGPGPVASGPGSRAPAGTGQASPVPASTEFYPGLPDVVWDEGAAAAVKKASVAGFAAFVHTGSGQNAWWELYAPLLTPEYADDAFEIDAGRITLRAFTSVVVVNDAKNPITATARFSTNEGVWEMLMHRTGADAPWLIAGFSAVKAGA